MSSYHLGVFFVLFSFREKEKRTRKESHKTAWVGPLRPPVSGTYLPRREKQAPNDGGGLPAGLRASPTPIRFLFFGSFFSFPERKERTRKAKSRMKSQISGAGGSSRRGRRAGRRCSGRAGRGCW